MKLYDENAEVRVLSAILVKPDFIAEIKTILSKNDFWKPSHQKFFAVALDLFKYSKPIDELIIVNCLEKNKQLGPWGGSLKEAAAEISILVQTNYVYELENALEHAKTVKTFALKRRALSTVENFRSSLVDDSKEFITALEQVEKDIKALQTQGRTEHEKRRQYREKKYKQHTDLKQRFDFWKTWNADGLSKKPPRVRRLLEDRVIPSVDKLGQVEEPRCFMPLGNVGILAATGGSGKTQILIQLALSIATGIPWLGRFGVVETGKVILALGETDSPSLQRRLYYSAKRMDLSEEQKQIAYNNIRPIPLAGCDVRLETEEKLVTTFNEQLWNQLEDEKETRLIILDPGSRFMPPEAETDNHQATLFIEQLERLTMAPGGPTVLLSHHTRKGGGLGKEAARGASALTDGARWVANLEKTEFQCEENSVMEMYLSKFNDGRAGVRELIRFDKNGAVKALTKDEKNNLVTAQPILANKQNTNGYFRDKKFPS